MGKKIIKNFAKKYIYSFGDNLTNEQIKIVKNTLNYKACEIANAREEFKRELKLAFKKLFNWRKSECIKKSY